MFRVDQVCKWTTRSSLDEAGVQLGQDVSWREGEGGREGGGSGQAIHYNWRHILHKSKILAIL